MEPFSCTIVAAKLRISIKQFEIALEQYNFKASFLKITSLTDQNHEASIRWSENWCYFSARSSRVHVEARTLEAEILSFNPQTRNSKHAKRREWWVVAAYYLRLTIAIYFLKHYLFCT